jgi:hypothetical protein
MLHSERTLLIIVFYLLGLIVMLPLAFALHTCSAEKLGLESNLFYKVLIYGVLCAPCFMGDKHSQVMFFALYYLFQGYGTAKTLLYIFFSVVLLYAYLVYKKKSF